MRNNLRESVTVSHHFLWNPRNYTQFSNATEISNTRVECFRFVRYRKRRKRLYRSQVAFISRVRRTHYNFKFKMNSAFSQSAASFQSAAVDTGVPRVAFVYQHPQPGNAGGMIVVVSVLMSITILLPVNVWAS